MDHLLRRVTTGVSGLVDFSAQARYRHGGLSVRLLAYSASLVDEVDRLLGYYRLGDDEGEVEEWTFYVLPSGHQGLLDERIHTGQPIHRSELYPEVPFCVTDMGDALGFATLGDHRAVLDFSKRVAVCSAPENLDQVRTRSITNTLIVPMLNEILARREQYLFHCASLEWQGAGVMVIAQSGGGKTTAAMAMAEHGFSLLSDDLTILDVSGALPSVRGMARDVRLCPDTLAMFPRWRHLSNRPLDSGKVSLSLEELQGVTAAQPVRPRLILFPAADLPVGGPDAVRITPGEAIGHIVPHGMFVAGEYRFEKRLLAAVDLLLHVSSYRLRQHLDVRRLPLLVEKLLQEGGPD